MGNIFFLFLIFFKKRKATVGGESRIEIFEYNTRAMTFLQNLGKFTNSLKSNTDFPEITNNVPSPGMQYNITILHSLPNAKMFSKIYKKKEKILLVISHSHVRIRRQGCFLHVSSVLVLKQTF